MLNFDDRAEPLPPDWDETGPAGWCSSVGWSIASGGADPAVVAGALPADEATREAAPARRARVLIVEDELIIAWLLADLVQGLGYEVCGSAADEDEAVRLAGSTRPDLILMDVRLRGAGDGVRAAEAIRGVLPAVPVVFCTAYADDPATRARMAAAGAAGVLSKPILTEQLGPMLARLLGTG
jgi:CheY-like chemotaxis protein